MYALRTDGARVDMSIRKPYYDLLARLGNPHENLPPVIHVAGTNGKGSTVAFMRAMLEAAGHSVHVYTSPHLVRFNERIVLAGRPVDDDALESLLDEAVSGGGAEGLTFFEVTTACAFAAFARCGADVTLLETGMGGRLDCTNVVRKPQVTTITSIGLDHMEFLGTTLPQIAAEKAGIMKTGVPCVVGYQTGPAEREVMGVFQRRATDLNCAMHRGGYEWRVSEAAQDKAIMTFEHGGVRQEFPAPGLIGPHQPENAGIALAALKILALTSSIRPGTEALSAGLTQVRWPGRLQRLAQGETEAAGFELWLDGAHNEPAARMLAQQAAQWCAQDGRPLHLIIGMKHARDAQAFLGPLVEYGNSFTFTHLGSEKSVALEELAAAARQSGAKSVHVDPDISACLSHVIKTQQQGRILVTGSLYLVGRALRLWG